MRGSFNILKNIFVFNRKHKVLWDCNEGKYNDDRFVLFLAELLL